MSSFQENNENFTFSSQRSVSAIIEGYSTVVPSIHPRTKSERHTATVAWMKAKFDTIGDKYPISSRFGAHMYISRIFAYQYIIVFFVSFISHIFLLREQSIK